MYKKRLKIIFDIVVVIVFLPIIIPVLFFVSLFVFFSLGKPIFYSQDRPGYNEKIIRVHKFRTMTNARDEAKNLLPDVERLTKFGKFLRRTSIDELPSILNVIKCEMSLVGPRPLLVRYLDRYNEYQRRRHLVLPGITGWSQINGRNALTWEERFEYDIWYVENVSFLLDIKILLLTVVKTIRSDGVLENAGGDYAEFWGKAEKPADGRLALPVEQRETRKN